MPGFIAARRRRTATIQAQPSGDLDPERGELCTILEVLVVLHAVAPARPVGALEILCLPRQLSRVVLIVAAARTDVDIV
jgi:hypothetical protein